MIYIYAIDINSENKIFLITLSGLLSNEEGKDFLTSLLNRLKTFNVDNYYVIVDIRRLISSPQNTLNHITKAIELLVTAPFKGHYLIKSKNIIANSSTKRALRKR